MLTAWAFLAILYTTHAFRDIPIREKHSVHTTERATQPPQQLSSQGNDTEASTARVQPKAPGRNTYRRRHGGGHGTLAIRVPLHGNRTPIFGWHVAVYSKEPTYEQICGGSLVKKDTAISAAHCFWDEAGLMPAELFAVAVGQATRGWLGAPVRFEDRKRYVSNVSEIIVPPRFLGVQANFQDDIAVLRLETPVMDYRYEVRPVCVDFDLERERRHLRQNVQGLITGFGLTEENGSPSENLNYQLLPYVEIRDCIAASDPGFLKYLTSDKICAGDQKSGRALCRGDSGGGLLFFDGPLEEAPPMFLRGVASAAPRNNNACNAYAIASFTSVSSHRTFLREHIPGLEEECKKVYRRQLEAENEEEPVNEEDDTASQTANSNYAGNTAPQPVQITSEGVIQPVHTQAGPSITNTASNTETQCSSGVSNSDQAQKTASVTQLTANGKDATAFVNEMMRGNPNTNIYFFTGPVYSQGSAPTPVQVRPEQPTNIFVIVQN